MRTRRAVLPTCAVLLRAVTLAAAHAADSGNLDEEMSPKAVAHSMESYFRHPHYAGWNLAHVVFMLLAWVIAMPLAIMLSVAQSRYCLPVQIFFHTLNGFGVFTAIVYNASTPDLYPNDSHYGLGWAVVALTIAWTIMSLYSHFGLRPKSDAVYRKQLPLEDEDSSDDRDRGLESRRSLCNNRVDNHTSKSARRFLHQVPLCRIVLEKLLLLLGFAALVSGFIVSGGLFRDREMLNGLAHYIKGGIFMWYGVLTFGRWMGAFTEFGWAWNVRPQRLLVSKWKTMVPSAEFTESFVIWLYGASNVFLEHLSNWGGEWAPSDLEHLSITVLFFGGGLLGMIIDSKWARNLANESIEVQKSRAGGAAQEHDDCNRRWEKPKTYWTTFNPMPALTIMVLGMMMAAHHQKSMVSTMLHAQWGGLFSAFALARGVTYITLYLRPPTSHFPARPPSEIVASFCLCAGGIVFMNSASDIVWAIESNDLDAMTVFTVSMGVTGVILAWEVVLFAIKGMAIRKESFARERELTSL